MLKNKIKQLWLNTVIYKIIERKHGNKQLE